jgi:hypothetical protein
MRQHLFLHYGWFLQNLKKGCIRTNMHTTVHLEIDICYKKKCEKCLEAENIPLKDLLFYILKILDPYRYKSIHLTM